MDRTSHPPTREKSQGRKYTVIKRRSYPYSSFALTDLGKKGLFRLPKKAFGDVCEREIAKPLLAAAFLVYEPAALIQEAWDRLCLEMRMLYKRRYKRTFKEDRRLLEGGFHLPPKLSTEREVDNGTFPDFSSDRTIERMLKTEVEYIVHFWGNEFWISHDPGLGKQFKIVTPWANVRLYEIIHRYQPALVERTMIREVSKAYRKVILKRFPKTSSKDLHLLERCLSFFMNEDFFCVPKSRSCSEPPFYFIEVKGERVKTSEPSLTPNQKEFSQKFKGKVGILVLWVFLNRDNIKVQWLTPNHR